MMLNSQERYNTLMAQMLTEQRESRQEFRMMMMQFFNKNNNTTTQMMDQQNNTTKEDSNRNVNDKVGSDNDDSDSQTTLG